MKIVGVLFLCLVFGLTAIAQIKKPIQKKAENVSANQQAKLALLQKRKRELEIKKSALTVRFTSEHSELKTVESELKTVKDEIVVLVLTELGANKWWLMETDFSSAELMKVVLIQNQRIIELLENLVNKK